MTPTHVNSLLYGVTKNGVTANPTIDETSIKALRDSTIIAGYIQPAKLGLE